VDDFDLIKASDRIEHLKKMVLLDHPPEKCYNDIADGKSGNRTLTSNCGYCPFKFDCWADSNGGTGLRVFQYSNGSKYFTEVTREPRVDEISF